MLDMHNEIAGLKVGQKCPVGIASALAKAPGSLSTKELTVCDQYEFRVGMSPTFSQGCF